MRIQTPLGYAALLAAVLTGSAALAQQSGTTTGPAAGGDVKATTGVTNSSEPGKPNAAPQADKSNVSGAPAVPAKPGTEAGPSDKK
jgi:hypothetical protein